MLHYSDKTSDSCARQKFRHEKLTVSARFPNMQCSCSRLKCTHQFHLLMLYVELLPLTKIDAKNGKQTAINMQLKINSSQVPLGKFCWNNSDLFLNPPKILCTVQCAPKETSTFLLIPGNENLYSTSRGSCLEPKDLSEPLHLNQISIFMSGRFKHWVRNQYNLNCSGCIPAPMGLSPDPLKLPQIAFRVCFSPSSLCFFASCGACQKKERKRKIAQPPLIIFAAYLIL